MDFDDGERESTVHPCAATGESDLSAIEKLSMMKGRGPWCDFP
jgi:hypothetical protein